MDERVAEGRVVRYSQIGRQRPRSCRPNDDGGARPIDDGELYIDALADVVTILDFSFSEGRAARDAPINRFLTAINKALLDNVRKEPQFVGFIFFVEGQIRVLPFTKNAQTFKLL